MEWWDEWNGAGIWKDEWNGGVGGMVQVYGRMKGMVQEWRDECLDVYTLKVIRQNILTALFH